MDSYTLEPTGKGFDYKHGIPIGRKDFAQVYAGDVDGVAPDDVVAVYEDGSVEVFLTKYDPANPLLAATGGVGFHPMGVVIGAGVATVSTVNFIGTLDGYGTICRGGDFGCVSAQRAVFVGTTDTDDYVFVSPLNAQTGRRRGGRRLSTEREMDFSVVFTPLANTRHRTLSSVRFWADYDMTHQALAIGTGRESPNTLAYLAFPGFAERTIALEEAHNEESVGAAAARVAEGVNLICFANQFGPNRCHRFQLDSDQHKFNQIIAVLGLSSPSPPPKPPSPPFPSPSPKPPPPPPPPPPSPSPPLPKPPPPPPTPYPPAKDSAWGNLGNSGSEVRQKSFRRAGLGYGQWVRCPKQTSGLGGSPTPSALAITHFCGSGENPDCMPWGARGEKKETYSYIDCTLPFEYDSSAKIVVGGRGNGDACSSARTATSPRGSASAAGTGTVGSPPGCTRTTIGTRKSGQRPSSAPRPSTAPSIHTPATTPIARTPAPSRAGVETAGRGTRSSRTASTTRAWRTAAGPTAAESAAAARGTPSTVLMRNGSTCAPGRTATATLGICPTSHPARSTAAITTFTPPRRSEARPSTTPQNPPAAGEA